MTNVGVIIILSIEWVIRCLKAAEAFDKEVDLLHVQHVLNL